VAKKCYENSLNTKRGVCTVTRQPPGGEGVTRVEVAREDRPELADEVLEIEIGGIKFKLGKSLSWEVQDQIVEVIAQHMDAFAWTASDMPDIDPDFLCHHLTMDPHVRPVRQRRRKLDECKTTFMIELSCYCYKVIPFRVKNTGGTYQRLMDRVLAPMIWRNVQAYVDDMVVTSQVKNQHVVDLDELFTTIAKYRLKLNPEKCVFGVEAGKFLGFLLTERGIEANPEKCAAIIAMRSLISVKEVQQLTAQMVALSRFVLIGGDKGHPYF